MLEECVPLKPRSYYKRAKVYTIISAQGSKAISSNYRLQKSSSWSEISSCLKGYNSVFYQSLLPGDQNWWNSKKHVNWQYEKSVSNYCLTGICTWAATDTILGIFVNNEFQSFVPSFIHCNLSRSRLSFLQKWKSPSHKKVLMLLEALASWRQAKSALLAGFWLRMHSTHLWHLEKWDYSLRTAWLREILLNSSNLNSHWISNGWNTYCLGLCKTSCATST